MQRAQVIMDATNKMVDRVDGGESPTEALFQVAKAAGLTPNQIELTGRAYNTGEFVRRINDYSDPQLKAADFPIADATAVVSRLFDASPVKVKRASLDYDGPPAWYCDRDALDLRSKVASHVGPSPTPIVDLPGDGYRRARRLADREQRELADARIWVESEKYAAAALAGELRRDVACGAGPSFDLLMADVRTACGPAVAALVGCVLDGAPKTAGAPFLMDTRSWQRKAAALHDHVVHALAGTIAVDHADREIARRHQARLAAFDPRPPAPLGLADAVLAKSASVKAADGDDPLRIHAAADVINSLGNTFKDRHEQIEDDVLKQIASPVHEQKLRDIRTRTMLQDLMRNDPVIKTHDPYEVAENFNNLASFTPRLADQPLLMAAMLRRSLQGPIDAFEVKNVADVSKSHAEAGKSPHYVETPSSRSSDDQVLKLLGGGGRKSASVKTAGDEGPAKTWSDTLSSYLSGIKDTGAKALTDIGSAWNDAKTYSSLARGVQDFWDNTPEAARRGLIGSGLGGLVGGGVGLLSDDRSVGQSALTGALLGGIGGAATTIPDYLSQAADATTTASPADRARAAAKAGLKHTRPIAMAREAASDALNTVGSLGGPDPKLIKVLRESEDPKDHELAKRWEERGGYLTQAMEELGLKPTLPGVTAGAAVGATTAAAQRVVNKYIGSVSAGEALKRFGMTPEGQELLYQTKEVMSAKQVEEKALKKYLERHADGIKQKQQYADAMDKYNKKMQQYKIDMQNYTAGRLVNPRVVDQDSDYWDPDPPPVKPTPPPPLSDQPDMDKFYKQRFSPVTKKVPTAAGRAYEAALALAKGREGFPHNFTDWPSNTEFPKAFANAGIPVPGHRKFFGQRIFNPQATKDMSAQDAANAQRFVTGALAYAAENKKPPGPFGKMRRFAGKTAPIGVGIGTSVLVKNLLGQGHDPTLDDED